MTFTPTKDSNSRYSALRTVGTIYGALGWITLAGSVVIGIILASEASGPYSSGSGFVAFLAPTLLGAVTALPMLAAQDIVTLVIDLVSNARSIRAQLADLAVNEEAMTRQSPLVRQPPVADQTVVRDDATTSAPSRMAERPDEVTASSVEPGPAAEPEAEPETVTLTMQELDRFLGNLGFQLEHGSGRWTIRHPGGLGRHVYSRDKLKNRVEEIALENGFAVTWQE